ncbi:MAG TPA: hypothetical protein VK154_14535, partial [Chitinophagales bacterium]|nr:hypothetical protein [Chitinophagales bacterium]
MKYQNFTYRLFCIVSLSVLSIVSSSQTNISVSAIKMNVLYIGVDNPLSVAAAGVPDNKVTVSIDGGGGIISKTDAGLYSVKVTTQTDDCTVNVYVEGKLVGATKFRVRTLPEPAGSVGGFVSGAYVSGDVFRSQPGLGIYVANSPFDMKYEVLGFTLVLADDKGGIKTIHCNGALFSPEAKQNL